MEHTCVDLLLLHNLGLAEVLHRYDKALNTAVYFLGWRGENVLEVLVRSFIDLVCVLGWRHLSWEQYSILRNQVFDLVLSILRNDLL